MLTSMEFLGSNHLHLICFTRKKNVLRTEEELRTLQGSLLFSLNAILRLSLGCQLSTFFLEFQFSCLCKFQAKRCTKHVQLSPLDCP